MWERHPRSMIALDLLAMQGVTSRQQPPSPPTWSFQKKSSVLHKNWKSYVQKQNQNTTQKAPRILSHKPDKVTGLSKT